MQWITALLDIGFLLLAAFFMAKLVLKVKQYRNLIFVPILLLLATANLFTHLSVMNGEIHFYTQGIYSTADTFLRITADNIEQTHGFIICLLLAGPKHSSNTLATSGNL
jgi:uncharacterized protein involved in response to NO